LETGTKPRLRQASALAAIRMKHQLFISFLFFCSFSFGQSQKPLETLNLSNQGLISIPDSVFQLINLDTLDLGNTLTIYPPLSALIDSNANELSYIQEEIGNLKNLRCLILCANKLTTLPTSISTLAKLEWLDISFNLQFNIIKELDKIKPLSNLKVLKIAYVNADEESINIIKSVFPRTKVIFTLQEYIDSL
jgi:Leucine-rich repeat (LRR) protein